MKGLGYIVVVGLVAACASGAEESTGPTTFGPAATSEAASSSTTAAEPDPTTTGNEGSGAAMSSSSSGDAVAESSSGAEIPATCGDGTVDLGEQCDDGNDSDLDECTTGCTVPTCTDGIVSGMETDVDCGGPCQGCGTCGVCTSSDDCGDGLVCDALAHCSFSETIEVDWLTNCPTAADGVVLADLPAGDYRAVALPSGGSVWTPPHDPPTTGYSWRAECDGISLPNLRTPAGIYYATPEEAFANLIVPDEEFSHPGGDLVCYRSDSACTDNVGSVSFAIEPACP